MIYNKGVFYYMHFLMITMIKAMTKEKKGRKQKRFFYHFFSFFALAIAIAVILIVRGEDVDFN